MNNQTFTYGTAQALTANAYSRAYIVTYNYNGNGTSNTTATATATFNGWAESSTGAKVYNDKQSVSNLATSGTKTLYANWTLNSVTLPTPTRAGYIFEGWYTAASGGDKVGAGGTPYKTGANITLYAQWTANNLVRIYIDSEWKEAIPYIYTESGWKETIPYIYTESGWKQCN